MSLFSISLNFFWGVELFSASCMYCFCNSSTVISLKWVLVSFNFLYFEFTKKCQNTWKVKCKITYGKSNINLSIKGNAEIRFTVLHIGHSTGFFVKLSFARMTPLTSRAVIFFVFSPTVQHSIKGSLKCLSVSLSVSLGEAMSSDYLLSRSIDDIWDTSVFLLVRSLLSPILEREGLQRHNKCLWYS